MIHKIKKVKKINNPKNRKLCKEAHPECRYCGSDYNVSVHHILWKSEHGVDDSFSNLLSLCWNCHRNAHDGVYIGNSYISPRNFIIKVIESLNERLYDKTLEILRRKK